MIVNVVVGIMRDQTFGGEVPATLHLHNSLRDRYLVEDVPKLYKSGFLTISPFVHNMFHGEVGRMSERAPSNRCLFLYLYA